eukprot:CAMPEP_0183458886 /NCGR_PEP_ID=MMETSP0370-20130417/134429_1 /TAXON_ID=268820 /ORGANISM="Peridinium aciculiferum, Strain PAER-2" /LENGTH=94 /DNA_ID=CAMNT_0025650691 /DNA_START=88 /DNA_END=368 /DNA_ORIENTATION=+
MRLAAQLRRRRGAASLVWAYCSGAAARAAPALLVFIGQPGNEVPLQPEVAPLIRGRAAATADGTVGGRATGKAAGQRWRLRRGVEGRSFLPIAG